MSDIVLDNCVIAKWYLHEPDSTRAERLLTDTRARGEQATALDLAVVEVAQVLWKAHYRGQIATHGLTERPGFLLSAPLYLEKAVPLLRQATNLAVRYRRAVYDMLFVALVQQLDLPGITSDEPLYHAVAGDVPNVKFLRTL